MSWEGATAQPHLTLEREGFYQEDEDYFTLVKYFPGQLSCSSSDSKTVHISSLVTFKWLCHYLYISLSATNQKNQKTGLHQKFIWAAPGKTNPTGRFPASGSLWPCSSTCPASRMWCTGPTPAPGGKQNFTLLAPSQGNNNKRTIL